MSEQFDTLSPDQQPQINPLMIECRERLDAGLKTAFVYGKASPLIAWSNEEAKKRDSQQALITKAAIFGNLSTGEHNLYGQIENDSLEKSIDLWHKLNKNYIARITRLVRTREFFKYQGSADILCLTPPDQNGDVNIFYAYVPSSKTWGWLRNSTEPFHVLVMKVDSQTKEWILAKCKQQPDFMFSVVMPTLYPTAFTPLLPETVKTALEKIDFTVVQNNIETRPQRFLQQKLQRKQGELKTKTIKQKLFASKKPTEVILLGSEIEPLELVRHVFERLGTATYLLNHIVIPQEEIEHLRNSLSSTTITEESLAQTARSIYQEVHRIVQQAILAQPDHFIANATRTSHITRMSHQKKLSVFETQNMPSEITKIGFDQRLLEFVKENIIELST